MILVRVLAIAVTAAVVNAQIINQAVKLEPADGFGNDSFGSSVAVSGGLAAVGAHLADDNGLNSGSAYLFDADPDSPAFGQQLAKLVADDGAVGDEFGISIALSNGIAVVGADRDDDNGSLSGSAYLFDADPASPTFGEQLAKLLPNDGGQGAHFGDSAALADGVAAIGAPSDDENGIFAGAVYLFDADPDSVTFGQQLAKLIATGGGPNQFGDSVALSGGLVAIGAHGGQFALGAAYLFDADPDSPTFGQELAKFLQNDGASGDTFGVSIALSGGIAAVGAHTDNDAGANSCSAYLFDADPDSPTFGQQLTKLLSPDDVGNGNFGASMALTSGIVAVGAETEGPSGQGRGGPTYSTPTRTPSHSVTRSPSSSRVTVREVGSEVPSPCRRTSPLSGLASTTPPISST